MRHIDLSEADLVCICTALRSMPLVLEVFYRPRHEDAETLALFERLAERLEQEIGVVDLAIELARERRRTWH